MSKFACSYAYDVSCYFDFVVEAASEEEAERKIEDALKRGIFDNVCCDPCWETGSENPRVFVTGEIENEVCLETTLEELEEEAA